jgi:hypothetical protein
MGRGLSQIRVLYLSCRSCRVGSFQRQTGNLALRLLSAVSSQPNGIYVRFCVAIEFVLSRH